MFLLNERALDCAGVPPEPTDVGAESVVGDASCANTGRMRKTSHQMTRESMEYTKCEMVKFILNAEASVLKSPTFQDRRSWTSPHFWKFRVSKHELRKF